jgi:hypothetical protein
MKCYEYMVTYSIPNGTGRICITRPKKIKSYSDVEEIDKVIKNHNGLSAIVIDFKLLRTYREANKKLEVNE